VKIEFTDKDARDLAHTMHRFRKNDAWAIGLEIYEGAYPDNDTEAEIWYFEQRLEALIAFKVWRAEGLDCALCGQETMEYINTPFNKIKKRLGLPIKKEWGWNWVVAVERVDG
tara:strand:+ start:580 stop:918 length:339 start_codon:yes stop_codon:yes gene_type:complete